MKISYKFFKEYPLTRVLISKIMAAKFPEIKSSYRVKKMVETLGSEFEIYKDILKEKESIIKWEDKKVVNSEEVKKVFTEFYNHEFVIPMEPLSLEELKHIKDITPKEIEILEMISDSKAFDYLLA